MNTLADLRAHADAALLAGRHLEALHGYAVLTTLEPINLDARLRIADALLALGEIQRAAVVYTAVAQLQNVALAYSLLLPDVEVAAVAELLQMLADLGVSQRRAGLVQHQEPCVVAQRPADHHHALLDHG